MIQTDVFSSGPITKQKINYDKGDYDGLRSYINCDWNDS